MPFDAQMAAITVHVERNRRIGKPSAIVVEIKNRARESVAEHLSVMQSIGPSDVKTIFEQLFRKQIRRFPMPFDLHDCILGLVPHVAVGAESIARLEGRPVDFVESINAEGRYDVLAKVFVLVIAPDQDKIRPEGIQRRARRAHPFQ